MRDTDRSIADPVAYTAEVTRSVDQFLDGLISVSELLNCILDVTPLTPSELASQKRREDRREVPADSEE